MPKVLPIPAVGSDVIQQGWKDIGPRSAATP